VSSDVERDVRSAWGNIIELHRHPYVHLGMAVNPSISPPGLTLLLSAHTVALFVHDDFLRMFIARFVFCYAIMHMHIGLAAEVRSPL
jgi:hypothetical protein